MNGTPLPQPESEQLATTIASPAARSLYGLLFRRRDGSPPTKLEAGYFLSAGSWPDTDLAAALEELRSFFTIDAVRDERGDVRLRLTGWASPPEFVDEPFISGRLRAEVLAPQRCAQCGKTPLEDGVKLDVGLVLPTVWGGLPDLENLQPFCEQCLDDRRQYHDVYAAHAAKIRQAATYAEPQVRLGEFLRVFGGEWVRSDLLAAVASAREYQEDWQRRLRELRDLDWDYESERRYNEGHRVRVYYRLTQTAPWPIDIRAVINAAAAARRNHSRDR